MKISTAATATSTALVVAAMLAGCGSGSQPQLGITGGAQQSLGHHHHHMPCMPKVWVSDLSSVSGPTGAVYGYTSAPGGANNFPCETLIGPYNGTDLNAPFGLATLVTSGAGNLYVADLNNDRVVIFNLATNPATYEAYYNTTSLNSGQPFGLCTGLAPGSVPVLAVVTRYTGSTTPGIVGFYWLGDTSGSGPQETASDSSLPMPEYCGFDENGNFFVAGTNSSGVAQVDYLANGYLTLSGTATLVNSGITPDTNEPVWASVFSLINGKDTVGIDGGHPYTNTTLGCKGTANNYCEDGQRWTVTQTGGSTGPLHFGGPQTCTVTNWPNNYNAVYQHAPGPGSVGTAYSYTADYGQSEVLVGQGTNGGCVNGAPKTVSLYTNEPTGMLPVGLAVSPDRQW